eukprot:Opistho-1_new@48723
MTRTLPRRGHEHPLVLEPVRVEQRHDVLVRKPREPLAPLGPRVEVVREENDGAERYPRLALHLRYHLAILRVRDVAVVVTRAVHHNTLVDALVRTPNVQREKRAVPVEHPLEPLHRLRDHGVRFPHNTHHNRSQHGLHSQVPGRVRLPEQRRRVRWRAIRALPTHKVAVRQHRPEGYAKPSDVVLEWLDDERLHPRVHGALREGLPEAADGHVRRVRRGQTKGTRRVRKLGEVWRYGHQRHPFHHEVEPDRADVADDRHQSPVPINHHAASTALARPARLPFRRVQVLHRLPVLAKDAHGARAPTQDRWRGIIERDVGKFSRVPTGDPPALLVRE